ncbi:MAG: hypothetical protein RIM33_06000 [Alphaproteobacteria bacterium]
MNINNGCNFDRLLERSFHFFRVIAYGAFLVGMLSACEAFGTADETFGVDPIASPDEIERVDLLAVLTNGSNSFGTLSDDDDHLLALEGAMMNFDRDRPDDPIYIHRRNMVQDRVIAASNQVCSIYMNNLKAETTRWNMLLGGTTTLSAGLGSIFTAVDTVRALSGFAAILSGVQGQYNENYLSNQTIQVITQGIQARRDEILGQIELNRRNHVPPGVRSSNVDRLDYTVQRAVADAIQYHMSCSLIVGLEQAAESIENTRNPGVEFLRRVYDDQRQMYSAYTLMTEQQIEALRQVEIMRDGIESGDLAPLGGLSQ